MKRVLIDTNVLLTGAIWRGSFADALPRYRNEFSFATAFYCIAEAERKIATHASSPEVAAVLVDLLDRYLSRLGALVLTPAHLPAALAQVASKSDRPILATAEALNFEGVCTYNVKDFGVSEVQIRSPLGWLRTTTAANRYIVQRPVLGSEGTLLLGTRQFGDDCAGLLLEAPELVIRQHTNRAIEAAGASLKRFKPTRNRIPDGYDQLLILRYRTNGEFEVAAWSAGGGFPPHMRVDSSGKLLLATGQGTFGHLVRPGLSLGRATGLSGVVFAISGIPEFVDDRRIRTQVLPDECLEGVAESPAIEALIGMCCPVRSGGSIMGVEIPGAFSVRHPSRRF